jgi:hypothetical protein
MTTMMNDHFIQAELEYRRQQRLAAAAEYRRARSAARGRRARARVADVIDQLVPARLREQRQHRAASGHSAAASHGAAARAA